MPTKFHLVKATVFPVVMYGCESCTIKKKLKAKELMLLNCGVGEDSWEFMDWKRRFNQSILKEINSEYSLEGLMLKLKLQYFGHLLGKTDSVEKTLMMGKSKVGEEKNDRGWDCWMASPMQWTWVCVGSRSWWWTGKPGVLQSMGSQKFRHDWATELNWTDTLNWETATWPQPCHLIVFHFPHPTSKQKIWALLGEIRPN